MRHKTALPSGAGISRGNLVPALLFSLVAVNAAHSAEFSIQPSIAVSEEYNDNVFESNDRISDYITRLMPGVAFRYNAPFWDWDLSYNYDYRYYSRRSREDDDTHNLSTTGHLRIIDEFMLMDISDTYSRVSLNVARDTTREGLFANQSDSNNFSASPYFLFRPGQNSTLRTGYRYTNVWFSDPTGVDRTDHIGYIDATHDINTKFNLNANYTYTHEISRQAYDRHTVYAGGRYEYQERSFISAQGGYTFNSFKNGGDSGDPYWNAGITHALGTWSASLTTGVQYPVDPLSGVTKETDYSLAVNKEMPRGNVTFNLSYAEFSGANIDLENRYGAGIIARRELGQALTGSISCNIDRYNHRISNSYTRRIYVNPQLSYVLPGDFTISLNYVFVDSYSPVTLTDNYQVNRVTLELRKSFGRVVEGQSAANSGQ